MGQPGRGSVALRAGGLMSGALRDLVKPPFSVMLLLDLLVFGASASFSQQVDDAALFGALLLTVVSAYVQIATTMAAASEEHRSADDWIKLSFRRRVFWRFLLTGLVTIVLILLGLLVFVVGGLVLGAMLGLAQTVSILQRQWPRAALRKSVALSEGHRLPLGTICAVLYILPNAVMQTGTQLRWERALGLGWHALGAVATAATLVGVIALARAYVALDGPATEIDSGKRSTAVR
ncbi:MAG: hypothetical protein ACRDJL_01390 [Actinomycetota bacterium]